MIDTLLNHKSIRKYKDTPISDEILNKILESAIRGSNTGNMQVYSIIVTKEKELREELWGFHFKQDMVKQAPVVLTFCADINRFNKSVGSRTDISNGEYFTFNMNDIGKNTVARVVFQGVDDTTGNVSVRRYCHGLHKAVVAIAAVDYSVDV